MNFAYYTLLTLLMFVAILLVLLILIQKGRGGGLSSAFGGSGGSTAFGAKTGDVLTWATSIIFGIFIFLAVILDLLVGSQYKSSVPAVSSTGAAIPMTSATPPAMPGPVTPDTTPPPAAPAPVGTPTTNPVAAVQQMVQTAAAKAKSTTQP